MRSYPHTLWVNELVFKMADKMVSKWKGLKLSKEKEATVGGIEVEGEGTSNNESFALIRSLISIRPFNYEALWRIMERVWRPIKGKEFKRIGDNRILFVFLHKKDYECVLVRRPWAFEKFLLVVQEYDEETRPSENTFHRTPFQIRILDFPRTAMAMTMGNRIRDFIGECMHVDANHMRMVKGTWLRIQVMMDISKALRRGVKLIIK